MSKTAKTAPAKRSGEQPRKGGSFVRGADGKLTPAQGNETPAPSEQKPADSQPNAGKTSGQNTSNKEDGK